MNQKPKPYTREDITDASVNGRVFLDTERLVATIDALSPPPAAEPGKVFEIQCHHCDGLGICDDEGLAVWCSRCNGRGKLPCSTPSSAPTTSSGTPSAQSPSPSSSAGVAGGVGDVSCAGGAGTCPTTPRASPTNDSTAAATTPPQGVSASGVESLGKSAIGAECQSLANEYAAWSRWAMTRYDTYTEREQAIAIAFARSETANLRAEVARLKTANAMLDDDCTKATRLMDKARAETAALAERVRELEGKLADITDNRDAWMAHARDGAASGDRLACAVAKREGERDAARADVESVVRELNATRAELAQLRADAAPFMHGGKLANPDTDWSRRTMKLAIIDIGNALAKLNEDIAWLSSRVAKMEDKP